MRLGKLTDAFSCSLGAVTTELITEWLRALPGGGRTRNNYRNAVRSLFQYAVRLKEISPDHIDWQTVARAKEDQAGIEIYTPEEIRRLLDAAQWCDPTKTLVGCNHRYRDGQGMVPFLVLGAFAGLRSAEIRRQRWDDINVERGFKHTICTHLLDASDNLRLVQSWVGHANINNTVIYAQLTAGSREAKAREAFAKLPRF